MTGQPVFAKKLDYPGEEFVRLRFTTFFGIECIVFGVPVVAAMQAVLMGLEYLVYECAIPA